MLLAAQVLMVRPVRFAFNAEAARSNTFAQPAEEGAAGRARDELGEAAERIRAAGVRVTLVEDTPDPPKPDAVFPNNWVSFHPDGTTVLYPMAPVTRRAERRPEVVAAVRGAGWEGRVVDLSGLEATGGFLEGTGSLVLDHARRVGFAARSVRTTEVGMRAFEAATGYALTRFDTSLDGSPVYHTNVVLAVGPDVAVLAEELVVGGLDGLRSALRAGGREILPIEPEQARAYAGNLLWLAGSHGPVVVLSRTADDSLTRAQRSRLGSRVVVDIPTIERVGGGSARCLLAEVFTPDGSATSTAA